MKYPNIQSEIVKIAIVIISYLCFLVVLIITLHKMYTTDWYYGRELFLATTFTVASNVIIFKMARPFIESVSQLFEGVDVYMRSKLENYFEARDYYIMKHGEYRAGLHFSKRPDRPLRVWELDFEKRIREVNISHDSSQAK